MRVLEAESGQGIGMKTIITGRDPERSIPAKDRGLQVFVELHRRLALRAKVSFRPRGDRQFERLVRHGRFLFAASRESGGECQQEAKKDTPG